MSHNKLRFYCQLKSSFEREPYIDSVRNRNQRSWLTRVRISAHNLAIERGRYSNVPLAARFCTYCGHDPEHEGGDDAGGGHGGRDSQNQLEVDCEVHFLARCNRLKLKRACFLKRLECFVPTIGTMSELDLVKTMLCPVSPQAAKLADKYIALMFKARDEIDLGATVPDYPTWEPGSANPFLNYDFENDDESHHLADDDNDTTLSSGEAEDSLLSL